MNKGGTTDKDVTDRKRAADGFGIVKEKKQRREDERKPGVGGSISTSRMARGTSTQKQFIDFNLAEAAPCWSSPGS